MTGINGRPIPLLETNSNGNLTVQLLLTMAHRVFDLPDGRVADLERALRRVVLGSEPDLAELSGQLDALESSGDQRDLSPVTRASFLSVVEQFGRCFLMAVEIGEECLESRSIIKFSYLEHRNDPHSKARYELFWSLDDFGSAASFHVEFEPPPLLGITRSTLTESVGSDTSAVVTSTARDQLNICNFAARPTSRLATATLSVELAPKRFGVVSVSYSAAMAVAVVIVAIFVLRLLREVLFGPVAIGSTAGSMLLAGGGILLTWISRTPEDWMVAKVLRDPRRYLVGSAALLLLSACLMALPVAEPWRTVAWGVLALSAAVWAGRSREYQRKIRASG